MIDSWASYSVADFIPFSAEVYFRLIERIGEARWPLHLLSVSAGVAATVLAWRGVGRTAAALLSAVLVWVAVAFLMRHYAQLNWAGTWFGWAFVVEAGLIVLLTVIESRRSRVVRKDTAAVAGLLMAAFGLLAYPLIAPLAGLDWPRAETFGIHPDPTTVVALGLVLVLLRGLQRWLAAIVPTLWCIISALTLGVLQAPSAYVLVLFGAAGVALMTMIWSGLGRRCLKPS